MISIEGQLNVLNYHRKCTLYILYKYISIKQNVYSMLKLTLIVFIKIISYHHELRYNQAICFCVSYYNL